MKKLIALSLGLVLTIAFQNCGQPRFASAETPNHISTLPAECDDTTSCLAPSTVLGRYPTAQVTELSYSRVGGFPGPAETGNNVYPSVRIAMDHAAKKLIVLPLIDGALSKLTISTTPTPRPACEMVYGEAAYVELIGLLEAAQLRSVTLEHPVLIDAGSATLHLVVKGTVYSHLFSDSDNVRSGDVIVNAQALESKLIEYKNVGCPVWN